MAEADPRSWDDSPSVLVFADRPRDGSLASAIATGVGARVIGIDTLAAAPARLARQAAVDAVLFEFDGWSQEVGPLLDWAEDAARSGFTVPVMSFPRPLIDQVVAAVASPRAIMLCDASPEDRVAALAIALSDHRPLLHDHGLEADAERLRRLSQEVARIAAALSEISQASRPAVTGAGALVQNGDRPMVEIRPQAIRTLIRLRRLRADFFPPDLFADPAWDMLLDLMAARLEREQVAVSSLCIAAAVPPTTALRWIRTMTEQGLFERRHDPGDGRRIFIDLSDTAALAMTAYFNQVRGLGWRPE